MTLPDNNKAEYINGFTYKKQNFIELAKEVSGVILIEVNTQGIFQLTPHQRLFRKEFPLVTKWYIEKCIEGDVYPGELLACEEDGCIIMLAVTADKVVGKNKDNNIDVLIYTEEIINQLFEYIEENDGHNEVIVSGIMNRSFSLWEDTAKLIRGYSKDFKFNNWFVATK